MVEHDEEVVDLENSTERLFWVVASLSAVVVVVVLVPGFFLVGDDDIGACSGSTDSGPRTP